MNRGILIVVAVVFVLLAGALVLFLRPSANPEAPVARNEAPAATPAAPPPAAPLPPPAAESPRPAPRAAAPVPDAPTPPVTTAPAEPPPEEATLHIESDVPGAQVFLDCQFVGATPVTAEHVKPGAHQLNASAEGFDGIVNSLDVSPGPKDITLRFREVRLDLRIPVVHKHRIGSCMGQLIATPQGLRYETTDKDDAFSASLTDLDIFQVDYLAKNLRVKVKKGKQYNFTDPEGNADHLFVFQRDVSKVRDRLGKGDVPAAR